MTRVWAVGFAAMAAVVATVAMSAGRAQAEEAAPAAARAADELAVPGFGEVPVDAPAPDARDARRVVILAVERARAPESAGLARALAADGALVLRLELPALLARREARRCVYLAGELEELAQDAEKRLGLPEYLRPVVVGVGLGASGAWAAVEEAPVGTFQGAALAELCPARPIPAKLCKIGAHVRSAVAGGTIVPAGPASAPVAILAPEPERGRSESNSRGACPTAAAPAFAAAIPGASLAPLPGRPGDPEWLAAIRAAVADLAPLAPLARPAPPPGPRTAAPATGAEASVDDLPLVEVPTAVAGSRFAILLTGDGGWAGIDRGIAAAFAEAGVPVVGLDSTKYFWRRRTPEETAAAVARIARHYRTAWKRDEVLLVGYSRGAELVPFLPPRMAEDARAAVKAVVMMGPSTFTEFEVHAIDLLWSRKRAAALPTRPAAEALGELPVVCVQGTEEEDSLCPEIASRPSVRRLVLAGGHHFGGEYGKLAKEILEALAAGGR